MKVIRYYFTKNGEGCVGFYRENEARKFWFREGLLLFTMLSALGFSLWR